MTTQIFTFERKDGFQFVRAGGKLVGRVKRIEDWTVRGTRVRWEAWSKGCYISSEQTRKAAAALLVHHDPR